MVTSINLSSTREIYWQASKMRPGTLKPLGRKENGKQENKRSKHSEIGGSSEKRPLPSNSSKIDQKADGPQSTLEIGRLWFLFQYRLFLWLLMLKDCGKSFKDETTATTFAESAKSWMLYTKMTTSWLGIKSTAWASSRNKCLKLHSPNQETTCCSPWQSCQSPKFQSRHRDFQTNG